MDYLVTNHLAQLLCPWTSCVSPHHFKHSPNLHYTRSPAMRQQSLHKLAPLASLANILWEPLTLVFKNVNPCTWRAQGGLQRPSRLGAMGGLSPKPYDTWGGAHWHPSVHRMQEGRIHMKRTLQNFTMYLKYRRGNVLMMFRVKCTPKHNHLVLTNLRFTK